MNGSEQADKPEGLFHELHLDDARRQLRQNKGYGGRTSKDGLVKPAGKPRVSNPEPRLSKRGKP
jgi:hypothetical protein